MKCYLGLIESRGTYYNFKPQYLYMDKNVVPISRTTLNNIFPEFGSINLAYKMYAKSEDFLRSLNVNRDNDDKCDSLYAVFFYDDEIEENNHEKIKTKLDLQKLYEKDIQLNDRIKPLCDFGMYKIVTPINKIIGNEAFTSMISINENFGVEEKVLLQDNDLLYGPFAIQERVDGLKYIRPDSGSKKYILDYVKISNDEIITFEKEIYLHETIYTDVAIVTEDAMHQMDVITDSVLLSKIQEKIDIQLLKTNPNEFEYLYLHHHF